MPAYAARILPAPYSRLGMLALVLPGCGPGDCPKGSVRHADDGLCHLIDHDDDDDGGEGTGDAGGGDGEGDEGGSGDESGSGDDGGGDDGEDPPIADNCEPPATLPTDPLQALGEYFLQDEVFAEAVDIEVDGTTVLVAGHGGLMVLDISDPADPVWVTHDSPESYFTRFQNLEVGRDGIVFATNWDYGLAVYNINAPGSPDRIADVNREGAAGMALVGDNLFVVDKAAGQLAVYDTTVPSNPRLSREVEGLSAPYAPFVQGDRLYVADNTLGIVVFDISSPDSPVRLGAVETGASVQDLDFSADGATMYAAAGGAGVQVWALDDPDQPALVDTLPLAYSVLSVATGDGLLWAVDQQDVVAIDISTPRAPLVLNAHETGQWSMHVAAVDNQAWVADWAWMRGYAASGAAVGDLDPATDTLYLDPEGGSAELKLANLGGAEVTIAGIEVGDTRVSWEATGSVVDPGTTSTVTLSWEGGEPFETSVCIASDDPDTPVQEVALVSSPAEGRTGVGSIAPDFALQDLDGNTHRLSDQRGRPVVLAYFATW